MKIKDAIDVLVGAMKARFQAQDEVMAEIQIDVRQCREGIHRLKDALVPLRLDMETIRNALEKRGSIPPDEAKRCRDAWDVYDEKQL